MNRIIDLITPDQLENKPAAIKITYYNLDRIDVKFEGQYTDVIGLGADIYSLLVTEVIDKALLDLIIRGEGAPLYRFSNERNLNRLAKIHFTIDENSMIESTVSGHSIALAAAYVEFLKRVCARYDISLTEYHETILGNYEMWSASDKKDIFLKGVKQE